MYNNTLMDFGENTFRLQKKVQDTRKKYDVSLKHAWDIVLGKRVVPRKSRKSGKSPKRKSPVRKLKRKKMIAGRERTIYKGANGGHFYNSKGRKVYIPSLKKEGPKKEGPKKSPMDLISDLVKEDDDVSEVEVEVKVPRTFGNVPLEEQFPNEDEITMFFGENTFKLQKKVQELRKKYNISLKHAWDIILGKRVVPRKSRKSGKSPKRKSPVRKLKRKKMIAGRERTIYKGANGGHFYNSKGRKVYLPSLKKEGPKKSPMDLISDLIKEVMMYQKLK